MDSLRQDIQFAIRTLWKHRTFSITSIVLIALSVGAATATFGIVNAVLLRPLPYDEPDRLVALTSLFQSDEANRASPVVRLVDLEEVRKSNRTMESVGGFGFTRLPVRARDESFLLVTAISDSGVLQTLRNALAMGSNFDAEDTANADKTVIISDAFWHRAFDGAPDVIGQAIEVSGSPYTVRGVLAEDFQFPRSDARIFRANVDLLIPAPAQFSPEISPWRGIARLRSGVGIDQGNAELEALSAGIAEQSPERAGWSLRMSPLKEETTAQARRPLLLLFAISTALLFIACTNLMNLLLSRSATRIQEMGIRAVVGATAARLVRQQLTEALCLAVVGGAIGVALGIGAMRLLAVILPVFLPVSGEIGIDLTVLAFAFSASVGLALIAGLLTSFATASNRFRRRLTSAASRRGLPRAQQVLCVVQVALCVGSLGAAGVLTHSLWRISTIDTGLEIEDVLAFHATAPARPADQTRRFIIGALAEIEAIPGVVQAAYATFLPPESRLFGNLSIGARSLPEGVPPYVNLLLTSKDYFTMLGITVKRGRGIEDTDDAEALPIAVVNESFVQTYLDEDTDPIGSKIELSPFRAGRDIVGVMNDVRNLDPRLEAIPLVYLPYQQANLPYGEFAVRAGVAPAFLIPVIRARLNDLDPSVALDDFNTLDDRLRDSLEKPWFNAALSTACAVLAVLFVTVGLYGAISHTVSRRTLEFGIRAAVGAQALSILALVLRQSAQMAFMGILIGVALSLAVTRTLASLLFQVAVFDPVTLGAAVALVAAVAVSASLVPAVRASRISPATALRHD